MAQPHQHHDFVPDLFPESERNRLKVNSFYHATELAEARQRERGIFVSICNISSKYLESQQLIEAAINRIIWAVRNHTGYLIGGTLQEQQSDVIRKRWALEATYRLIHDTTGEHRVWVGSWRNSLGRLTDFEDLLTRAQIVNAVTHFAAPGAVEEKLAETFGLESKWQYDGLVSLVVNLNLKGSFGNQFRNKGFQVTFLDF